MHVVYIKNIHMYTLQFIQNVIQNVFIRFTYMSIMTDLRFEIGKPLFVLLTSLFFLCLYLFKIEEELVKKTQEAASKGFGVSRLQLMAKTG